MVTSCQKICKKVSIERSISIPSFGWEDGLFILRLLINSYTYYIEHVMKPRRDL